MYINNKIYINDIERIIKLNDISMFKEKNVFITGASGLVGSFLVDTLMYLNKKYNYNIKIFATFTTDKSYKERFPSYLNEKSLTPIIQDITKMMNFNQKIDYIIHAASNTHPILYAEKPVETIKLNISGTINVLELAKRNKNCKTIFLSTLEVYGEDKNVESFREDNIGCVNFNISRSCYPESKRLCETMCHAYIKEFGLNINIVRLGYIYGPTVKLNSSKADVQFIKNALAFEPIILKSSGMQKRSYCYVADTISAILTVLFKGLSGEAYNIASTNGNVLLKDYATTLAKIANVEIRFGELTEVEKYGGSKVQNSTLDNMKLKKLGWNSEFTFSEGIEHTYKIKKEVLQKVRQAKCK